MGYRLYNGVSLPVLPEWDKGAFPYAYIAQNIGVTAYILTVAAERPVYGADPEDSSVNSVYHYGRSASYLVHEGAWLLMEEEDELVHVREDVGKVIWTNTDILHLDGSLYLAADSDFLGSFQVGLALGLCGKGLLGHPRMIEACLYNGIPLPSFPEHWNIAPDDVVVIAKGTTTKEPYYAKVMKVAEIYADRYGVYWILSNPVFRECTYEASSGEWYSRIRYYSNKKVYHSFSYIAWSNRDVPDVSGGVYLPGSNPVPVYKKRGGG